MQSTPLYWSDNQWPHGARLAISPRPRGGDWLDDELAAWRDALGPEGVVVSLLTPDEVEHFSLQRESETALERNLRFYSFPIVDRSVPGDADGLAAIDILDTELHTGHSVLVHCRQGVGRSGLIAAGLLIKNGMTPEEAMRQWKESRGVEVPETIAQAEWLRRLPLLLLAAATPSRTA
jgi:protein-tyrosine phosphatase